MDWEALRAQLLEVRRLEQAGSLKLEVLVPVTRELGILLDGAMKQVSEEFLYLIDSQRLLPCLQEAVLRVRNIPEGFEAFGTLLISLSIREVHAEYGGEGLEEASWQTFRNRFNALPKTERHRILQVLPASDLTPYVSRIRNVLPDEAWIDSWKMLCEGIPAECFPVTWRKLIAKESPSEADLHESEHSVDNSILDVPHIILSRERERRERRPLGTWLFRLASLKELQNPNSNRKELVLPRWVVPRSSQEFLADLQGITSRIGGVPDDSQLRSLLEQIRTSGQVSDLSNLQVSASQILQMSSDWNAPRVHVEGIAGITHLRAGNVEEARMAYMRMFNQAESKQDAAMALANLAGTRMEHDSEFPEAYALLDEALRLHPWSNLSRRAMDLLVQLQRSGTQEREGSR